jgi:uncharacterized protein YndB with AHSA1/START domain
MNTQPFVIERTYNAPVDKVWKAITDKNEMKQWYFDLVEFRPEAGFEFQFYGQEKKVNNTFIYVRLEVIKEKKLQYSWRYDGYEGISFVTFELFAEGNTTRLKLTHEGLETFPVTANNAFTKENFAEGWTHIIGISLPGFVEK